VPFKCNLQRYNSVSAALIPLNLGWQQAFVLLHGGALHVESS
jgi:hypothetical protein